MDYYYGDDNDADSWETIRAGETKLIIDEYWLSIASRGSKVTESPPPAAWTRSWHAVTLWMRLECFGHSELKWSDADDRDAARRAAAHGALRAAAAAAAARPAAPPRLGAGGGRPYHLRPVRGLLEQLEPQVSPGQERRERGEDGVGWTANTFAKQQILS